MDLQLGERPKRRPGRRAFPRRVIRGYLIDLPCAERGIVLKRVGRPANRVLGAAHIEVPSQAAFVSDHVSFSRFGQPRLKFGPRVFDPSHLG